MVLSITRNPRGLYTTAKNICTNPSFETNFTGWTTNSGWFGSGGAGVDDRSQAWANPGAGTWSAHKKFTTRTDNAQDVGWTYKIAANPGDVYTVSAQIYQPQRARFWVVNAFYLNKDGGIILKDTTSYFDVPAAGGRIWGTFSCPGGTVAVNFTFTLYGGSQEVGDELFIDSCLIMYGSTLVEYFDGSSARVGHLYSWEGTPHASGSFDAVTDDRTVVLPTLVIGYDVSQAGRNLIHQLVDGPVAATVLPSAARSGTLRLFFDNAAQAETCRWAHAGAGVWTYVDDAQPQEGMTYVVAGVVRKTQQANRLRWVVEVPYQEVTA